TIFMSSHVLSDVEDICDRVSVMSQGTVKAIFRLDEIPKLYGEKFRLAIDPASSSPQAIESIRANAEKRIAEQLLGKETEALVFKDYQQAKTALEAATKSNVTVYEFRGVRPRLEEIFISLTKGKD